MVLIICSLLLYLLQPTIAEKYYVSAYPNGEPCPSEVTCHDLTFYLSKNLFLLDNSSFLFLEGVHQLPEDTIYISNLANLTFEGLGVIIAGFDELVTQSTSVLQCSEGVGGIVFDGCENIVIRQLTVNNCNNSYNSAITINKTYNIELDHLSVQNSSRWGLFLFSVGNITMKNLALTENYYGNALIFTDDGSITNVTNYWYLDIANTNITYTRASSFYGLFIYFSNDASIVNIKLTSCNIVNNYGSIVLSSLSCQYTMEIRHLFCASNGNDSDTLAAFLILQITPVTCTMIPSIAITDSIFIDNHNSFIVFWSGLGMLQISSSNFTNNTGDIVLGIGVWAHPIYQTSSNITTIFTELVFSENKPSSSVKFVAALSISSINSIYYVKISNCTFSDNIGPGICIQDSAVMFAGKNIFTNNRNTNGGAINIYSNGYIFIERTSQLIFVNNSAIANGGAIYTSSEIEQTGNPLCFFQLEKSTRQSAYGQRKIFVFENNTAGKAGTAIYGKNVGDCLLYNTNDFFEQVNNDFFMNISSFGNNCGTDSLIATPASKVCFCNDLSDYKECEHVINSLTTYPGGTITLSLVAVGTNNGLTTGTVEISGKALSSLVMKKTEQLTNAKCTNISYVVHSVTTENLTIRIVDSATNFASVSITLVVTVLPCPKGFNLNTMNTCDCIEEVMNTAECYSSTLQIGRSRRLWIGYNEAQNCTIITTYCPFDYCMFQNINITLVDTNTQCAFNRFGQYCGKCNDNSSLVLGSNACKDCSGSNYWIILIVPAFAVAGIVLVSLLIFLNLTVSVGTINGVVFFANIVKLYEPLFPHQSIPVLSQFITWINLDLGIETCFFDGMNAFHKVGLQFVFPLYIWLIVIVIIMLSKRFSKLAHIVGNNSIPVLATLILLSYTKLIRTVILVLSRTYVKCGDSTTVYWYVDPTREYLIGGHIVLFVVAIIVMVLFVAPYTLFLLLYPVLELANTKWRQRLSWFMFKLKPFFDAYRGPHTNLFSIWPGVLLLVRIVLALVIALTEDQTICLAVTLPVLIILIIVLSNGRVYKETVHHLLDGGYIAILILFGYIATLLLYREKKEFEVIEFTILRGVLYSICFIIFLGILCFHISNYTHFGQKLFKKMTHHVLALFGKCRKEVNEPSSPLIADNDCLMGPRDSVVELKESLFLMEDIK